MIVSDFITDQLKAATTRKQCIVIILEECFREEEQEAALDWCEQHRKDLFPETEQP